MSNVLKVRSAINSSQCARRRNNLIAVMFGYLMLATVLQTSVARGQDLASMRGTWVCQSGCGCAPASPGKFASIKGQKAGVIRNECGNESELEFLPGKVKAKQWGGLEGAVSAERTKISWGNGAIWQRLPANAPELERRKGLWESRSFYCPSGKEYGFASKEAEGGAPACDDGDSVMFNALLCRMGDPRGCRSVQLSQGEDGRFWRSPERAVLRASEPPAGEMKRGESTFSGDHATGLFLYFGHTKDSEAFRRWIKWIDSNERCQYPHRLCVPGTPRYCKHDKCAFQVGDCQILVLLGQRLNVTVPFCSPVPMAPVPTVVNAVQTLKDAYDKSLGRFPVQPPELRLLRDNFDNALRAYQQAVAPLDKLRLETEAKIVRITNFAQIKAALSARLNSRGYSRHNAMVVIMMLQDWGMGNAWMTSEARRVARSEPLNPFFQYVANRRSNKQSMLPLILDECPADKSKIRLRRQWSWERDTNKREWLDTMYWDCLFIADAYNEQATPPADDNTTEAELRRIFSEALGVANRTKRSVDQALSRISKLSPVSLPASPASDPAKAVKDKLNDVKDTVTRPGPTLKKKGEELLKRGGGLFGR